MSPLATLCLNLHVQTNLSNKGTFLIEESLQSSYCGGWGVKIILIVGQGGKKIFRITSSPQSLLEPA